MFGIFKRLKKLELAVEDKCGIKPFIETQEGKAVKEALGLDYTSDRYSFYGSYKAKNLSKLEDENKALKKDVEKLTKKLDDICQLLQYKGARAYSFSDLFYGTSGASRPSLTIFDKQIKVVKHEAKEEITTEPLKKKKK